MQAPSPEWLLRQVGYAPIRTTTSEVLRTVGFVAIGIVAGATAVALLTPKTGKQLRGDIAGSAANLKQKAGKLRGQIAEQANHMRDNVREGFDQENETIGSNASSSRI